MTFWLCANKLAFFDGALPEPKESPIIPLKQCFDTSPVLSLFMTLNIYPSIDKGAKKACCRPFLIVTGVGCKYLWKKRSLHHHHHRSYLDLSVEKSVTGAGSYSSSQHRNKTNTTEPADIWLTFGGHQGKVCKQLSKSLLPPNKTVECFWKLRWIVNRFLVHWRALLLS